MSAATVIDVRLLQALRHDIDDALASVAAKHGILIRAGKGTYGGKTGSFVLELAVPDGSGATNPTHVKAAADWTRYHAMFDLPADGIGKVVQHSGQAHTIIGLMPGRRKYPVLVSCGGRELLLTAEEVALRLKVIA